MSQADIILSGDWAPVIPERAKKLRPVKTEAPPMGVESCETFRLLSNMDSDGFAGSSSGVGSGLLDAGQHAGANSSD